MDAHGNGEILIAGLGSVGRRHLANLTRLGWPSLRGLRSRAADAGEPLDIPVEYDLDAALARRPLAVVVATPSALHVPVALAAARAGCHLFVEKPLSHTIEGLDDLEEAVTARDLTALVGFQFRFNPGLRQLKAWIDAGDLGTVVSAHVHWGEYLPGMHPWEDFRLGYAARPELGGGVLLTFCHPFDYLRWLLGEVDEVSAVEAGHRPFGLTVDTCVDVVMRFAPGAIGHVHLDFVQRPHQHNLTIVGTEGTATWTHDDHAARLYRASEGRWDVVPAPAGFERNSMFVDEMQHFLACLRGEAEPACTLAEGRAVIEIVDAARQAARAGALARATA